MVSEKYLTNGIGIPAMGTVVFVEETAKLKFSDRRTDVLKYAQADRLQARCPEQSISGHNYKINKEYENRFWSAYKQ